MSGKKENPYLAYLPDNQQGISSRPMFDLLPRKVTANVIQKALEHDFNLFTNVPHTPQYRNLLESRKKLPVFAQMDNFYKMFNSNQIMIVVGEPGSGKTTQIPQFVAYSDLPHTKGKIVGCTQPWRATTLSVAKRVADQMDVQLGQQVGYSTCFEDMTQPSTTFLKYMTDDVLLREATNDSDLNRYSTIILDEVYERTVATDVLLGLLKSLVKRRPDLKLIIVAATVGDVPKFQMFFGVNAAPLLLIPGHVHPVEVFYTQEPEPDYVEAAIRTVFMIHRAEDPGDILLFLPGAQEIEEACRRIKLEIDAMLSQDPEYGGPLVCIPLYLSLSPQQQQRIFDPPPQPQTPGGPPGRKVVVSTNIAETSFTFDGIVYVVDSGFAEQRVYNPRIRVNSILTSPISKASAQQRAARAGRMRPGKCFRLFTGRDFNVELDEKSVPEILRYNLASTVLQMVKAGAKDLVQFDYIDCPAPETLLRALELLNYLFALDDNGNLTSSGSIMAEFPLDPQLAKMLILSPEFQCSNDILTIAAMLSVPSVWIRPTNKLKEADAARATLTVPDSDHLTLLNVYNSYMKNKGDRNWAWNNFLSAYALSQAENARRHLECIMERCGVALVTTEDEGKRYTNIKKVLCCGFFMQVAHKEGKMDHYTTVKDNQVVALHPSCSLQKLPEWVIFNEFVLTTRPYIQMVTEVRPEWLLEFAPCYFDLAKFPHSPAKKDLLRIANKKPGQKKRKESR